MLRSNLLLAWLAIAPTLSMAQSWNVTVYDPRENRPWPATLTLAEKDGVATLSQSGHGTGDPCTRPSKAAVERTATTITITKEPVMNDCRRLRYVIRANGTGGKVQYWDSAASNWTDDPRERKLTLVQ